MFKLNDPIKYLDYSIPALELIEPRAGQVCDSVFQHAEFIVEQPFDEFIEMYPGIIWDTSSMHRNEFSHLKLNFENGMTLKFLHAPILELISKS